MRTLTAAGEVWKNGSGLKRGGALNVDEIEFVVELVMGWIGGQIQQSRAGDQQTLCVNLCVKKVPKLAKTWKIDKNVEIVYRMLSVFYCKMRRLERSEALSSNP